MASSDKNSLLEKSQNIKDVQFKSLLIAAKEEEEFIARKPSEVGGSPLIRKNQKKRNLSQSNPSDENIPEFGQVRKMSDECNNEKNTEELEESSIQRMIIQAK